MPADVSSCSTLSSKRENAEGVASSIRIAAELGKSRRMQQGLSGRSATDRASALLAKLKPDHLASLEGRPETDDQSIEEEDHNESDNEETEEKHFHDVMAKIKEARTYYDEVHKVFDKAEEHLKQMKRNQTQARAQHAKNNFVDIRHIRQTPSQLTTAEKDRRRRRAWGVSSTENDYTLPPPTSSSSSSSRGRRYFHHSDNFDTPTSIFSAPDKRVLLPSSSDGRDSPLASANGGSGIGGMRISSASSRSYSKHSSNKAQASPSTNSLREAK